MSSICPMKEIDERINSFPQYINWWDHGEDRAIASFPLFDEKIRNECHFIVYRVKRKTVKRGGQKPFEGNIDFFPFIVLLG